MKTQTASAPDCRLAFVLIALTICSTGILGCGESRTPPAAVSAVTGKVLLASGKPVPGGKLVLCPEASLQPDGRRLSADLGNDGSFTIESSAELPIFAGRYKVFVVVTGNPKLRSLRRAIPEKYQNIGDDDSDVFIDLEKGSKELSVKLAKS